MSSAGLHHRLLLLSHSCPYHSLPSIVLLCPHFTREPLRAAQGTPQGPTAVPLEDGICPKESQVLYVTGVPLGAQRQWDSRLAIYLCPFIKATFKTP